MARNLIFRVGLDASDFQRNAKRTESIAKSMSEQIKRSMSWDSVRGRVSDILGNNGSLGSQIRGGITDSTIATARAQLEDLTAYQKTLAKIGVTDASETYGRISEAISELTYDIQEYMTTLNQLEPEQTESNSTVENSKNTTDSFKDTLKRMTSAMREHIRTLKDTKKNTDSFQRSLVSTHNVIPNLVKGFRNLITAGIAVRLVGSIIGRLRSIVSTYIAQNASLQSQVNGLKNAMGQSLAPAINIVVNAMSALIPVVVGVSNAIGSLIGLLGGKWASAAGSVNKYASAVGSAGTAQKKANRELLSFDEINKLSDDSSDGASGGSGSSGNAATIVPQTPSWAERLKTSFSELFTSDEFSAANIGGKLGMAIKNGLDWLRDEIQNLDWQGIGQTLKANWDSFWNSGVAESFAETFGVVVGAALAGIGALLLDALGMPFDELKQAFENEGASGIGLYVIGMTSAAVLNFVSGFFSKLLSPMFSGLAEFFEEHGMNGIAGFFQGLSDGCKNIGKWIKEKLVDPLVTAVKNLLGIHSPSTVFAGFAQNCVDGFLNKFTQMKAKIEAKLNAFKTMITDTATSVKNAFNFNFSIPKLKLPHLSVQWEPVSGILAQFLGSTQFPHLNVQWYAKGGILDGAQIFGVMGNTLLGGGESGREAVLPLDRNTWWMDELAQRVASLLQNGNGGDFTVRIPVSLDGRIITEVVANNLRSRQRAMGSAW